jgi:hypothetical protein
MGENGTAPPIAIPKGAKNIRRIIPNNFNILFNIFIQLQNA